MRLQVVSDDQFWGLPSVLLIPNKDRGPCRATVEEQDIPIPFISLLLHQYYTLGNVLLDAGPRLGSQLAVSLPFLRHGRLTVMKGVAAPMIGGPLVAVPMDFFDRGN